MMGIQLVPRAEISTIQTIVAPIVAFLLAIAVGALLVLALGASPAKAFEIYFLQPFTDSWAIQALILKATPLIIIGLGLIFCFRANRWNIGAEGQYIIGAMFGGWLAINTAGQGGLWLIAPILLLSMLGGALFAAIPAQLRNRFGVNEILTSLMLVYVAKLALDYAVRGPWRDPASIGFPQSVTFDHVALPRITTELHIGVIIAALLVIATVFILARLRFGFAISVTGEAPRAATFSGFNDKQVTLVAFMISGALAGLAGMIEVLGPIGRLQPVISPDYGFTAIIVAFLGRLSPVGVVIAGFAIALTLIGSETAQIMLKLPLDLGRVFQGLLLFFVLAGETLTRYTIRWRRA
jgi:general nucleoside transport system permease protein